MYQRIVVPLDGSGLAEAVLPYATTIAKALESELHLVQVVRAPSDLVNLGFMDPLSMSSVAIPNMETLSEAVEAQAKQAEQYLRGRATEFQEQGLMVRFVVLRGNPSTQIIKYAQDEGADLIAISTHGRSGISRMVLGSVADKVVRQVNIPVLLIRPQEGETQ